MEFIQKYMDGIIGLNYIFMEVWDFFTIFFNLMIFTYKDSFDMLFCICFTFYCLLTILRCYIKSLMCNLMT